MGATNMRVPGRNIYMSVHGGVSTHNFVYTNIFVCRLSRIQYPKNQPIDASWHDSCHIASGPCIVVPAYLFIQACSFLRLFRHNFAENGPQDLRENGLKRRVKQFYTICDKNQLINTNIGKVTVRDRLLPMSSNFGRVDLRRVDLLCVHSRSTLRVHTTHTTAIPVCGDYSVLECCTEVLN